MTAFLIVPIIGVIVSIFLHWKFKDRNALRVSNKWIEEHKYLYKGDDKWLDIGKE